jgi:hypothetical protein
MSKQNRKHQINITKRRTKIMLSGTSGGGFANTGRSRNDVRVQDANDAIAEALEDRRKKKDKE